MVGCAKRKKNITQIKSRQSMKKSTLILSEILHLWPEPPALKCSIGLHTYYDVRERSDWPQSPRSL